MGSGAGRHHAGEISRLNRVNGGAAHAFFGIRIFGVYAAGTHRAVFATGRFCAYRTRLHTGGPIKSSFDLVYSCFLEHLRRGLTVGPVLNVWFFSGERFDIFIFVHGSLLLIIAK